jgi:hypothetical protein
MDDFDLRMERAALEGAVSRKPTLGPFVSEATGSVADAVAAATEELDKT